jgi:predicted GH43/DUF377 family glycosyl hydrolase
VVTPAQPLSDLPVRRLPVRFESDVRRVIVRPFVMSNSRIRALFDRLEGLTEDEVEDLLGQVRGGYGNRHRNLDAAFDEHFVLGSELINWRGDWSAQRRALAGAYMTMEYSIDSAALFNPSIVPHPDQSGLAEGAVRFLMSLRATGEGHVSSIVFRTGVISADLQVQVDPLPTKLHRARVHPDRFYEKNLFRWKLSEMGVAREPVDRLLERLGDRFTLPQITLAVEQVRPQMGDILNAVEALRAALWLAQSNYHIDLSAETQLSELVIFPMNDEESRGIEDLRMVRFIEEDGAVNWYGTYTAYNGFRTLPMLMSSAEFGRVEVHSLNGGAALNKGMALFPRRVNGYYCMCSRIDGESLFISYSPSVHFWHKAERLIAPMFPWELMQIGNCGSPIETPEGWVLLTHGVGPMRSYAIGAMLLDLNDPLKVIGHLRQPLLTPVGEERDGYVPNVVYTCGALAHRNQLFIPFAAADRATSIAVVALDGLVDRLLDSGRST